MTVVLIPGGLYENMTAERFWGESGVVAGLEQAGLPARALDRLPAPRSWAEEVEHLAAAVGEAVPAAVVAGSNGCSAAVCLAVDHPRAVSRLVLCWPATAGDPAVDDRLRSVIEARSGPGAAERLLAGETLRGVTDRELAGLAVPAVIVPSVPENPFHRAHTARRLRELIPGAVMLAGFPEAPREEFTAARERFVATLVEALSL